MDLTKEQIAVLVAKAAHDDHVREINKRSFAKRQTWIKLVLAKAAKAGIKVSDAEVDAEVKKVG